MLGIPKGLFIVAVSLVFRGAVYYNPFMFSADVEHPNNVRSYVSS
jgi:hypothetical protein